MQTQVEELPENRVRLTVDVPQADVEHAVEHAASDLAGSMRIPGFRKGKVPLPVLVARIGKKRLLEEAVSSHIGSWFWNAAASSRIRPIAQPEYGYELPESDQQDFQFTATVDVQPKAGIADWKTLEVGYPDVEVPEGLVDHELDVLRGSVAELAPVDGRPATEGDTVVVDLVASRGEAQRDLVVELGQGILADEIEQAIVGTPVDGRQTVELELGDDSTETVEVHLKELKEKVLPALDDELARAASEFETLEELRAEIESRLRAQLEEEAEAVFREAVVDALVEASDVQPSPGLVEARASTLWSELQRSLERRGVSVEAYLKLTGSEPAEVLGRLRDQAARSVARELVLEAVADQLGIQVADEELEAFVRDQAEAGGEDPNQLLDSLRAGSGLERIREDLRLRAALDRVAAEVKRVPASLASAREKLWTPEKEKTPADTKLWTPASKERASR
jgi:trigger factor